MSFDGPHFSKKEGASFPTDAKTIKKRKRIYNKAKKKFSDYPLPSNQNVKEKTYRYIRLERT